MVRAFSASWLLALLMAGCPDRTISEVNPNQTGVTTKDIPVSADVDILFVIDNSASTTDKQTIFAANFKNFVAALDAFPTGRPNLHIGVINTTVDIGTNAFGSGCPSPDPKDDGLLQNTPHVMNTTAPTGRFISDIKDANGVRQVNYTGTLEDELSTIAQVGASGCGFEAPLEAVKRALDPNGGVAALNKGFLRDGAYLAIVFLTDEDDASVKDNSVFSLDLSHDDFRVQPLFAYQCDQTISATVPGTYTNCKPRTNSYLQDPAFYSTFLAGVKDPAQMVVAVIAGPPPGLKTNDNPALMADSNDIAIGPLMINGINQPMALLPSCSATINGNAAIGRPAVRLASFLSAYGNRGKFYSVCQSDYSAALKDIGQTLFNAISPCLEGNVDPRDTDATNPGLQLQCSVQDIVGINTANETTSQISACKMSDANTPDPSGARPCWWILDDKTECATTETGFALKVERSSPPATGTNVDVQCALVPTAGI